MTVGEAVSPDRSADTGRARARRLPVLLLVACQVAGFVLLAGLYYVLARRAYGGDSDEATLVLQGRSVLHGNVLLNGWWYTLDPFWTTDVPFYTLGVALLGVDPRLLSLVPAVVAALVTVVGAGLVRDGARGRAGWIGALTTVGMIGLPSGRWLVLFTRGGWHAATVLVCLLAFAALRRGRWGARWCVGVALLAVGLLGDLQTIPLGVGAVAGAGILAAARVRRWRAGLPLVAAAAAGSALAYLLRQLAVLAGSFHMVASNQHASFPQIAANLRLLPRWLVQSFGSGDVGLGVPPGLAGTRTFAAAAVLAAMVAALVLLVRGVARGAGCSDESPGEDADERWRLDDLLLVGCCADVAFYLWATTTEDPGYQRYLTPLIVFGSVLAGRMAARLVPAIGLRPVRAAAAAAGVVVLACYTAAFAFGFTNPQPAYTNSGLAHFLAAHRLHRGLGSYWLANQTTVASGGRVVVRPVQEDRDGRLVRRVQLSNPAWYRGRRFDFLVYPRRQSFEGVTRRTATRTFGPPAASYTVGDVEVLTWSHPLRVSPTPPR